MNKPKGYDEQQVGGDYVPVGLGGHLAVIKRVEETKSQGGRPMLKVAIDFDAKDAQPKYFYNAFQADTRDEKKWPYQAVRYILTEDQGGNCSKAFKSFITSVEVSNNAKIDDAWGNNFEKWFNNKKIGVVYGEQEEEYNGEIKTRRKIRYFCDYAKAKDQAIPKKLLLDTTPKDSLISNSNDTGFMNIPDGVDEVIPF